MTLNREASTENKSKLLRCAADLRKLQRSYLSLISDIHKDNPDYQLIINHMLAECFMHGSKTKPIDILKTYMDVSGVEPAAVNKTVRYTTNTADGIVHFFLIKKNGTLSAMRRMLNGYDYGFQGAGAHDLEIYLRRLKVTHVQHRSDGVTTGPTELKDDTYPLVEWLDWVYRRDLNAEDYKLFRKRVDAGIY